MNETKQPSEVSTVQKFLAVVCVILSLVCIKLAKEVFELRDRVAVIDLRQNVTGSAIAAATRSEVPKDTVSNDPDFRVRLARVEEWIRQLDTAEGRVRLLDADKRLGRSE